MYVTTADALITVWNSKYSFNFWRPVTAILAADTDDNPDTEPGGMHYGTSGVHGTVIARKVARYVARHHFRPVTDE